MEVLEVSESYAYKLMKRLNRELQAMGRQTIAGKVDRKYFYELLNESQKPWNMIQSPLYYRYEDTVQGKAFSGLGKNFVRELYSEIENKKEYEFLRGNKELESIFREYLK